MYCDFTSQGPIRELVRDGRSEVFLINSYFYLLVPAFPFMDELSYHFHILELGNPFDVSGYEFWLLLSLLVLF